MTVVFQLIKAHCTVHTSLSCRAPKTSVVSLSAIFLAMFSPQFAHQVYQRIADPMVWLWEKDIEKDKAGNVVTTWATENE